ncbi:MAG: DUF2167 domain-containing protein [Erythrobacter sp.]|jgi:uncharacterized membrane-anchored protein|nr:DUF2167 domain-containing protein [Erythrobacter sp.]
MQRLLALFVSFWLLLAAPLAAQDAQEGFPPEIAELLERLDPQTGKIALPSAEATLDLGEDYIFYDADDTRDILTMLWGNPPGTANGVLGLVMPAGSSPLSDEWGAVVSFERTGYVSDEDAAETDYDELLKNLQEGTRQSNAARSAQGFPTIELVGWAERPVYDSATHSVVWAQDLAFGDSETNTLNYDVRTLGRYGVLSLNLVAAMPQLPEIRVAAKDFANHASFDAGARYADFDPSTDATADYGIAGLIAGGAGAAAVVAKKTGLIGIILAFFAKFGKFAIIGIVLFFGAIFGAIKSFFGGKDEEEYYEEDYPAEAYADGMPGTGGEFDAAEPGEPQPQP